MIMRCQLAGILFVGLLNSATWAEESSGSFTLGRYIPADSWMFMNTTPNPECAWIEAKKAKVLDALRDSGIDRDVMGLILSLVPEDSKVETKTTLDRYTSLVKAVRWGELVGGEIAFAERITGDQPGYEYIFLARGANDSNKGNAKALAALMAELAGMTSKLSFSESKMEGTRSWTLSISSKEVNHFVPHLTLFVKNEILVVTVGFKAADDVIALMDGKTDSKSIVELPRFKKAVGEVRAPEDAVMFFDINMLLSQIHQLFSVHIRADSPDSHKEVQRIKNVLESAIELCNIIDYTVTTIETDGPRQLTHTLTRLREEKLNTPLVKAFLDRKAFDRFDKYIPAEATGFSVDTTIDIEALYDIVIAFVRHHIPSGPDYILQWNEKLAEIGLDPQRDIFDWLSGELISVSLPPTVVTPMSSDDSVVMIRVKNPELASAKVRATIDFLQGLMGGSGQSLMVSRASVSGGEFLEVTHPLLMLYIRPVIGVHDEWLMIGTSAKAVDKCLRVAAGEAPSIMKNKRFTAEGLVPKGASLSAGAVLSASFKDTSNFGQELGAAMGMAGMLGGLAVAGIPDHSPESTKIKKAVQHTLSIVMKLAPVLQKIDYYSSEASITTRRGAVMLSEKVVTYKSPAAPQATATAQNAPGSK